LFIIKEFGIVFTLPLIFDVLNSIARPALKYLPSKINTVGYGFYFLNLVLFWSYYSCSYYGNTKKLVEATGYG
jgi:uncharacterized membrane protein YvlD (DUF360 family)